MLRNSFHRFFPAPAFLSMPSFGIDISDESIKFVELADTKNGIKVKKSGEQRIPAGIIDSGKIINPEKLQEILTSIKKQEGIHSVRVSLPEEQVYLFQMKLAKDGLKSIKESIELSLEEHIPIPAPDAVFDYELIAEDTTHLTIQVAAIPSNVIGSYLDVFKNTGLSVKSLELEAQAIARSVIRKSDPDTYMIVDFGEKRTGIFIVSKGIVMFTSTLDIGGDMLGAMIEKSFKVDREEAERIKINYGLQRNTDNKEIFSVLLNSVSVLRDELSKHFIYWHTHKNEGGESNPAIKKILLCGGDANLIGLSDYLSVSLKTKVEMADVWVNIINTENHIPEITFNKALAFASAVGLALGDFEYD